MNHIDILAATNSSKAQVTRSNRAGQAKNLKQFKLFHWINYGLIIDELG